MVNTLERMQTGRAAATESNCSQQTRRSSVERIAYAVYGDKLLLTAAITCAILTVSGFYLAAFFGYHGLPLPEMIDRITWTSLGALTALLTAASVKSQEGRKPPGR